jgi:hypothetical protein
MASAKIISGLPITRSALRSTPPSALVVCLAGDASGDTYQNASLLSSNAPGPCRGNRLAMQCWTSLQML